jgi:hypothetical protein
VPTSHSESELFKACTTITIENGRHTKFWLDRWLHGRNPIEIAPALFRLARRKHITVAQALDQGTWLQRLQRIETPAEVSQFIDLWLLLSSMQLTAQPDAIAWKITANGSFSTNSVYNFQFFGSYADHDWTRLWAAKAEGKCKMFCRLILQNRMWTADRIVKHGGEANPICVLCHTHPETTMHMLATCPYSKQVWHGLSGWTGMTLRRRPHHSYRRLTTWWTSMLGDRD